MIKITVVLLSLFFTGCVTSPAQLQADNIIMVVGDGMGPAYTAAYRYFSSGANGETAIDTINATIFDEPLAGMARTWPRDKSVVTDSAATALATGVKTFNGAIGVDVNEQPLVTLLQAAKARGYQTAMVATSSVTHATPASFAAHVSSRQSRNAIAQSVFR